MTEEITSKIFIDAIALMLFERIGRYLVRVFELDRGIKDAGLYIHPVTYACRILFYTLLSVIVTVAISILLIFTTSPPLVIGVIYLISCILIPIIVFALGLSYPSIAKSLRKLYVESELPFFIAYLATMAKGGVSADVTIARVANLRVFKYISAEAGRVMRSVKVFGDDPITAIERVVREHPSSKFRDVMLGYVATLRAGGDVVHYLETRAREILAARALEIRQMISRLSLYLELYLILGIVVSLTVFTFFAVSGAVAVVGGPKLRTAEINPLIPLIYSAVITPALGITTLILIHLSHPRTSLSYRLPYIMMMLSIPIALPSSLAIMFLGNSWNVFEGIILPKDVPVILMSVTIALLLISIPPWITYSSERKGIKGVIKSLADFLRDLSEVRKSGLSPEKCFIVLAERSYGNLTGIIRRAATALAMGISLDKALARAVGRVKDWFLAVIFRFLIDSVLVGGGSPEVIDALANFTQELSESEDELRRSLRIYILLPYFGTILIAVTPGIIIWQLISASTRPPEPNVIASLATTLSLGAIINSYIMGLIAGKASSLTTAAGFKHSALMTTITTVTIMVILSTLKLI